MIREQSRFAINPLYIVGVAMCCICLFATTLYSGLILSGFVAVVALIVINLVSLVEKIANKNLRAFLVAMISAGVVVVASYIIDIVDVKVLSDAQTGLNWSVLAIIALCIVPTYFETRLTTKNYFSNMFFCIISFFVLMAIYSLIIEFLGYGTIAGISVIKNFVGYQFARQYFFDLFVIAFLIIVSNFVYQKIEDRNMKFNLLVDRYKLQIRRVLNQKENNND